MACTGAPIFEMDTSLHKIEMCADHITIFQSSGELRCSGRLAWSALELETSSGQPLEEHQGQLLQLPWPVRFRVVSSNLHALQHHFLSSAGVCSQLMVSHDACELLGYVAHLLPLNQAQMTLARSVCFSPSWWEGQGRLRQWTISAARLPSFSPACKLHYQWYQQEPPAAASYAATGAAVVMTDIAFLK